MPKNTPPPDGQGKDARNTAMADLLRAKGFAASATPPVPTSKPAPGDIDLAKTGKIVVRRERKGRGGKTVTVVSGIERPPTELARIAQALRKALGCGSTVEGATIVLQGDIVPRVQTWLQAHGATRIVQGT